MTLNFSKIKLANPVFSQTPPHTKNPRNHQSYRDFLFHPQNCMKGWISRPAKFRNLQHLAYPLILKFASSHYLSEENVAPAQGGPHLWEGFLKTDNDAYLFRAVATSTAQATVHPTIGLLPIPRKPIISTWAGTDEEPANCASECIRPMVSVIP